jgi:hypothetical protein
MHGAVGGRLIASRVVATRDCSRNFTATLPYPPFVTRLACPGKTGYGSFSGTNISVPSVSVLCSLWEADTSGQVFQTILSLTGTNSANPFASNIYLELFPYILPSKTLMFYLRELKLLSSNKLTLGRLPVLFLSYLQGINFYTRNRKNRYFWRQTQCFQLLALAHAAVNSRCSSC